MDFAEVEIIKLKSISSKAATTLPECCLVAVLAS
jgi:hypothetical protein